MGTVVTIDVYGGYGPSDDAANVAFARASGVLHEADNIFSTWKSDSTLSRLRRGEITIHKAPAAVGEIFELCKTARKASRGWFDPWAMPGGFDPSGYVKGWAAQRALDTLVSHGISNGLVNAAGDIAGCGGPDGATPFRIGIVDPSSPSRLACVVELAGAIATSGTYERGAHLFDPHARRAEARLASASVSGPDLGLADALATALAVAGEVGLQIFEDLEGYEALAIGFDGTLRWTERFPFALPTPSSQTSMSSGLQLPQGYARVSSGSP